jgi:hypothetical protein
VTTAIGHDGVAGAGDVAIGVRAQALTVLAPTVLARI